MVLKRPLDREEVGVVTIFLRPFIVRSTLNHLTFGQNGDMHRHSDRREAMEITMAVCCFPRFTICQLLIRAIFLVVELQTGKMEL